MVPTLRISLLGDFLLLADDMPVTSVAVPRMRSLLVYLLLHRQAPQDRSHLAFLLWPDSSEAQAHTNLRKLLHQLRQAFPQSEHFLFADKQTLQWRAATGSFTLDVEELEQACAQAAQAERAGKTARQREALELALQAYRGDLLPGCYDEWLLLERERLRQVFLAAAQDLSALLEQEREYKAALSCTHQFLRHDPLHEATYRQLMRLHTLLGDRAAALRAYHTCARLLERELGAEPSAMTQEVYEALTRSEHASESQPVSQTGQRVQAPLQGRKAEWRQLQQLWQSATGGSAGLQMGSPRLVLLTGEAGIGKTRLASELELWVSRLGQVTASARCYPVPGHLAYAPITSWLRSDGLQSALATLDPSALTEIARLVPEVLAAQPRLSPPAPMSEGWQRQFFYAALARAVLSARQPLLLLLDDLQWCDEETLQWLHYLLHFATDTRMLLVGTIRVEETTPEHPLVTFLETLQRDGLVTEIPLGPLTQEETSALAASLLGEQFDPAIRETLYHETEGNPLFIVEMARASAQREDSVPLVPQGARPLLARATSPLPPAVQAVLATRLAQLSTQARMVANLAAVIGREFTFPVLLRAIAGQGEQAMQQLEEHVVRGLDELWQRRIVREQNAGGTNTYEFSHDKIREHISTSLSPVLRRTFHGQVAQALEAVYAQDLDAVCGQIAAHYEQAGLPVPAAAFYQRTGQVAGRVYAHAEALRAFEKAAALLSPLAWPPEVAERAQRMIALNVSWETFVRIYTSLGDAYANLNEQKEARLAYQRALASAPAGATLWQARLHRKIAVTQTYSFAHSQSEFYPSSLLAFAEAERILTQSAEPANPDWRDEWLELHFARVWHGSEDKIAAALEKAQPVVEQYGTQEQRKLFTEAQGIHNAIRSRFVIPADRVAAWRASIAALEPTANELQRGMDLALLGIGLLAATRFDEAEEQLRQALRLGERTGNAWLQKNCLTFLPFALRQRGLVAETRAILARAQTLGIAQDNAVLSGHQAWVAWRSGDLVQAEACGRESLQTVPSLQVRPNPFLWTGRWPLIGVAHTRQQTATAITEIRQLFDSTQQPPRQPLATLLTILLQTWDAGEQEKAHTLLQQALPIAAELGYL